MLLHVCFLLFQSFSLKKSKSITRREWFFHLLIHQVLIECPVGARHWARWIDPVQNVSLQHHRTHISFTLKSLMLFSHGPSWPVASKFLEGSSIFSLATTHPVSTLGHLHPATPLKLLLLSSPGPQGWRLTFCGLKGTRDVPNQWTLSCCYFSYSLDFT